MIDSDEAITGLVAALDPTVILDTQVRLLAAAHGLEPRHCAALVLPVVRDLLARGFLLPV